VYLLQLLLKFVTLVSLSRRQPILSLVLT
jgi:hypothetical protein